MAIQLRTKRSERAKRREKGNPWGRGHSIGKAQQGQGLGESWVGGGRLGYIKLGKSGERDTKGAWKRGDPAGLCRTCVGALPLFEMKIGCHGKVVKRMRAIGKCLSRVSLILAVTWLTHNHKGNGTANSGIQDKSVQPQNSFCYRIT